MSESTSTNSSQLYESKSGTYIDSHRSVQRNQELGIHKILKQSFQEMNDASDMKALLPIAILLDEMSSDSSETRTYCLQNLSTIALALGPARAKGLIGGFISNILKDQDEGIEDIPEEMKVMYTLLESLPRLVNLIGGPDHAPVLLQPLLDTISDRQKDETKTTYLQVIRSISSKMFKQNRAQIELILTNKIEELQSPKEQNTAIQMEDIKVRTSKEQQAALQIISYHYNLASPETLKIWLDIYKQLMLSNIQEVRKRAVLVLKDFINNAETDDDFQLSLSLAKEVFTNGKDFKSNLFLIVPAAVKHPSCKKLIHFKKLVQKINKQAFISLYESFVTMQNNNAYNVFLDIMIESLNNMRENKIEQKIYNLILDQFLKLSQVQELDIKRKIASLIGKLIVFIKESKFIYKSVIFLLKAFFQYLSQFQQLIQSTALEKNYQIRQNIIDSIVLILNQNLEKKLYYSQDETRFYIRQLFINLQAGDNDPKFKFLSKQKGFMIILQHISDGVFDQQEANQLIESLVKVIRSLEVSTAWRMRHQTLASIKDLLLNLIDLKYHDITCFDEIHQSIYLMLQDRISAIREESYKALNILFSFYKQFNKKQLSLICFEKVKGLIEHQNYLVRVNLILGLREAFYIGEPLIAFLKTTHKHTPNVKLALLEILLNQKQKYPELLPINDPDQDVRECAQYLSKF